MSEGLVWTPHPVLKIPTVEQMRAGGREWTEKMYNLRETMIAQAAADPLRHGHRPWCWKDAMEIWEQKDCTVLVVLGGGGASKTFFAADVGVNTLLKTNEAMGLWLHESTATGIRVQQKAVYKYLPPEFRPTDNHQPKRGVVTKLKYSVANGFSDGTFVFPNGSTAVFGSYKQDIQDFEGDGWNIFLPDEDMPLPWFRTQLYRLPRRDGKMLWTFTPIRGMTPTIKYLTEGAKTLKTQECEMLPQGHRVTWQQDWPAGTMPYIQRSIWPGTYIMYWPTKCNPWARYERLKSECFGKPVEEIERRFYGFARNTANVLVKLTADHLISPEKIPKDLTTYMVMDPALARNSFIAWEGVDKDGRRYTYDEWPDRDGYGEWATESDNSEKLNGDHGPAQTYLGLGVVEYKRLILEKEGARWDDVAKKWDFTYWREPQCRFIDCRAGNAEHLADEEGDSSIIFRFSEEQYDRDRNLVGPAMNFEPSMPKDEREGFDALGNLLAYNTNQPMARYLNEPRKYFSTKCEQTIWCLRNYRKKPGHGSRDEACKDPVDCQRYLATEELEYVPKANRFQSKPRSYNTSQQRDGRRKAVL